MLLDPRAWKRFKRHRGALAGGVLVILLACAAVFGPLFAVHDPLVSDFANGVAELGKPAGPSAAHWLGVDGIYRDHLTRLLYGARISLTVALLATAISAIVGAGVGMVSGYARGTNFQFLDTALMRFVDIGLSFPYLLLVMAIGAAVGETSVVTLLAILGFTSWFTTARVIRSKTIQVRSLDFISASRAIGLGPGRILLRHILPNVAGPLIVIATTSVAQMIIAESALSFLQVGLPPPIPTWGRMLEEGQKFAGVAPGLLVAPATCIFLSVLAFNWLGEGLRDALDPKEE